MDTVKNNPANIVEIISEDKRVKMYSLPKAIPGWPTFNASKQRKAADQNLFFQLVSSSHRLRFEATLDLLRKARAS